MYTLKQTFLWQLFPPNNAPRSFILGTMHVKDARVFVMQHHLIELIREAELYAAETNLHDLNGQEDFLTMLIPDGRTIKEYYTDKQYSKMQKVLQKAFGVDIEQYLRFRPFFISSMVDQAILSKDMPYSLDESLWRYADEQGKEMTGVESYADQLNIMNKIPVEVQARQLLSLSKKFSAHRKEILKLTELYVNGDIKQLHRSARKGMGNLRKMLLWERNYRMADRIDALIREQSSFCAIGAGHLWGKKGVLKLLKDKGVKMEPIKWQVDFLDFKE